MIKIKVKKHCARKFSQIYLLFGFISEDLTLTFPLLKLNYENKIEGNSLGIYFFIIVFTNFGQNREKVGNWPILLKGWQNDLCPRHNWGGGCQVAWHLCKLNFRLCEFTSSCHHPAYLEEKKRRRSGLKCKGFLRHHQTTSKCSQSRLLESCPLVRKCQKSSLNQSQRFTDWKMKGYAEAKLLLIN